MRYLRDLQVEMPSRQFSIESEAQGSDPACMERLWSCQRVDVYSPQRGWDCGINKDPCLYTLVSVVYKGSRMLMERSQDF